MQNNQLNVSSGFLNDNFFDDSEQFQPDHDLPKSTHAACTMVGGPHSVAPSTCGRRLLVLEPVNEPIKSVGRREQGAVATVTADLSGYKSRHVTVDVEKEDLGNTPGPLQHRNQAVK